MELEIELTQTHMVQKPILRVEGEKKVLVCLFEQSFFNTCFTTLRPCVHFKTFTLTFGFSLKACHCSSLPVTFAWFALRGLEHSET